MNPTANPTLNPTAANPNSLLTEPPVATSAPTNKSPTTAPTDSTPNFPTATPPVQLPTVVDGCTVDIPDGASAFIPKGNSFGQFGVQGPCGSLDEWPSFCNPIVANEAEYPYCMFPTLSGETACARDSEQVVFVDTRGINQRCACIYFNAVVGPQSSCRDTIAIPTPTPPPTVTPVETLAPTDEDSRLDVARSTESESLLMTNIWLFVGLGAAAFVGLFTCLCMWMNRFMGGSNTTTRFKGSVHDSRLEQPKPQASSRIIPTTGSCQFIRGGPQPKDDDDDDEVLEFGYGASPSVASRNLSPRNPQSVQTQTTDPVDSSASARSQQDNNPSTKSNYIEEEIIEAGSDWLQQERAQENNQATQSDNENEIGYGTSSRKSQQGRKESDASTQSEDSEEEFNFGTAFTSTPQQERQANDHSTQSRVEFADDEYYEEEIIDEEDMWEENTVEEEWSREDHTVEEWSSS
jgi:hypothetical protein